MAKTKAARTGKGMSFEQALATLKKGHRVARRGWNGKDMWIELVREWYAPLYGPYEPTSFIGMKTADNKFVPWLASQTDLLSSDWERVKR